MYVCMYVNTLAARQSFRPLSYRYVFPWVCFSCLRAGGVVAQDVRDAAAALDEPCFSAFKTDAFFVSSTVGSGDSASAESCSPDAWSTREFVSAMEEAAAVSTKARG